MRRKILPYNPKLIPLARKLRNNSTLSEILLWNEIKGKKLGHDFHRQKPIANYIVDFYCPDLLLVIEIDGSSHRFNGAYDVERQKDLEAMGVEFLRFDDLEVKADIGNVVEAILWKIEQME